MNNSEKRGSSCIAAIIAAFVIAVIKQSPSWSRCEANDHS
jgi:hypothetical protein